MKLRRDWNSFFYSSSQKNIYLVVAVHCEFTVGYNSRNRSSNDSSDIPRNTRLNIDYSSASANVLRNFHEGGYEVRMPISCFKQSLASLPLQRGFGQGGYHEIF